MKNTSKRKWIIIISILAAGCVLYITLPLLIRTYIIQAYKMPSGSMKPTLLVGDHILADKFPLNLDKIERGDIIVFVYPPDPRKDFVKRVVGLPGETIEIRDRELYIDGNLLEENYVLHIDNHIFPADVNSRDNFGPIRVPENSLFVLGDNREASYDSRFWGFVELTKVKGKVTKIYWSWDKENSQVRWERIGKTVN